MPSHSNRTFSNGDGSKGYLGMGHSGPTELSHYLLLFALTSRHVTMSCLEMQFLMAFWHQQLGELFSCTTLRLIPFPDPTQCNWGPERELVQEKTQTEQPGSPKLASGTQPVSLASQVIAGRWSPAPDGCLPHIPALPPCAPTQQLHWLQVQRVALEVWASQ